MDRIIKIIEWQQDFCGKEPECLEGKKSLPAVPPKGAKPGTSDAPGSLAWSYKKGQKTRVQVLETQNSQENYFLDVDGGHQISRIPRKAFRFLS
jgi:hypothetical protein